jgi:serine/threonine protein kinase
LSRKFNSNFKQTNKKEQENNIKKMKRHNILSTNSKTMSENPEKPKMPSPLKVKCPQTLDDALDQARQKFSDWQPLSGPVDFNNFQRPCLFRAVDKETQQKRVLKIIRINSFAPLEVLVPQTLADNANVVDMDVVVRNTHVAILSMPLAENGDLFELAVHANMEEGLQTDLVVHIAQQLASALAAVHDAGYVHLDIKLENVLLGDDNHVVLTDFALARRTNVLGKAVLKGPCGTDGFVAPEIALSSGFSSIVATPKSDIYAFGVALYQLLTGSQMCQPQKTPADTCRLQLRVIELGVVEKFVKDKYLQRIVKMCLDRFPSARPTAHKLKQMLDEHKQYSTIN